MVQREATSNLMIFPGIDFHFGEAQYSLGGFGILLSNKYWGNYIVPCKLHNFVIGFHFITIHLCYVEEKVSIILFPILSPWMSFLFPTISIVTSATLAANHHCPFSIPFHFQYPFAMLLCYANSQYNVSSGLFGPWQIQVYKYLFCTDFVPIFNSLIYSLEISYPSSFMFLMQIWSTKEHLVLELVILWNKDQKQDFSL